MNQCYVCLYLIASGFSNQPAAATAITVAHGTLVCGEHVTAIAGVLVPNFLTIAESLAIQAGQTVERNFQ